MKNNALSIDFQTSLLYLTSEINPNASKPEEL